MFRFLYFLLMMYLVYKALRYFMRIFSGQKTTQNNSRRENQEIIDIDYEEINDEEKSSHQNK